MQNYYVYVYLDPRREYSSNEYGFESEPFYVGKGLGERDRFHLKNYEYNESTNPHRFRRIKNIQEDGYNIIVKRVYEGLEEDEAYEKEREVIKNIGRRLTDRGPLTNIAEGGNGISGNNSLDLTDEEINDILLKYKNPDIPVKEIVDEYDISHGSLTKIRRAHKIERVSRHPPNYIEFSEDEREYIVEQYTENFVTDRELSGEFDVSRNAIKRVLKEEDVEFHSRKDYIDAGKIDPPNEGMKVDEDKKEKIIEVYKKTGSVTQACREVGMEEHYGMIYNRFKKDTRGPTWVEEL